MTFPKLAALCEHGIARSLCPDCSERALCPHGRAWWRCGGDDVPHNPAIVRTSGMTWRDLFIVAGLLLALGLLVVASFLAGRAA